MDVASPLIARSAGRTTFDTEGSTLFTLARKFSTLATQAASGWHHDGGGRRYRGSHLPSATGQGHPEP